MDIDALAGWEKGSGRLPERLSRALERALVAGTLGDGPLPSERRLARALGISRGTVTAAYAELKDRKLLASRPGGYTQPDPGALAAPVRAARLAARGEVEGTILRDYVERDPAALDLTFAFLDPPQGMEATIRAAYAAALDETPHNEFVAAGLSALRERIASWYTHVLRLRTSVEQIVITQGAYQAIALVTLMTCSPGDTVVTESPIYAGALDLFHAFSARMHPVGSFDDPRVLETLERGPTPSLVYASSAYRNPAGTVLDARSAARLARWSARTETPVVDDRALAPCGFTPIQPRPLAAYAPDAPILTLGSFDKLTGAGTRIGWIRAPRSMVAKAVRLKALSDLASPPYLQRVAIHLCDDAEAFAQARRLELTRRYETMARHLRARFPHWRWETPQGGASIWIDLGSDADAFARAAGRAGVSVVPGAAFRPEGTSASYIRLAFARPEAQLVMAVERLASVRLTR